MRHAASLQDSGRVKKLLAKKSCCRFATTPFWQLSIENYCVLTALAFDHGE